MPSGPGAGSADMVSLDPASVTTRADLTAALNAMRERRGLSVRDLAKITGSPTATVGGYLSGRHLPPVAQATLFRTMLEHCGVTDPDQLDAWWAAVGRIRRTARARNAEEQAPYRGLAVFQAADSGFFFGRDSLIAQAIDHMRRPSPTAGRMLAVVGASGSGKSSLVRAGIVPAVAAGAQPADSPRPSFDRAILLVPGHEPLRALAEAIAGPDASDDVREQTRHELVERPVAAVGPRTLVVVDQFEEVFNGQVAEDQRRAFLESICDLATADVSEAGGPWVLITLRADFYGPASAHPHLLRVLSEAQLLVGAMTGDELRAAIERPAELAGLRVDADLVERILRDMTPRDATDGTVDAGALPLMSHALQATWMRSRQHLTLADYLATGGIDGAVAQTAEDAVRDLDADALTAVQRLFLRLVDVSDGTAVTRRSWELADLPASVTETIIDRLAASRLITTDRSTVQISHEALLVAWPRLRTWIELSRADLRLQRQLADGARQWADHSRDPSFLLRGSRLELVRAWVTDRSETVDLSPLEAEFLADSEAAQAGEQAAERHRRRRGRLLVAVLVVVALVASGLAVVGVRLRDAAAAQADLTGRVQALLTSGSILDAANRVGDDDANLAAQLSLVAHRIAPTAASRSAVLNATAQPLVTRILGGLGPTMQTRSPDGSTLAVADAEDGSVRLFTTVDHQAPDLLGTAHPAEPDPQFSLAFVNGGRTLFAGNNIGEVQGWDVKDPSLPRSVGTPTQALPAGVLALAATPDGTHLFAGGTGGQVRQWSVAVDGALTAQPDIAAPDIVQALAVSPDGTVLAVGGASGEVSFWAVGEDPVQVGSISVSPDAPFTTMSLAYSPDGGSLAVGGRDGTMQIWSTGPTPTRLSTPELTRFGSWVNVVTFSPDGRTFAAGSSDGQARLWSTADWSLLGSRGQPAPVTGLTVGTDDVATSASDGTTRLSSLSGPRVRFPGSVFSTGWGAGDGELLVGPGGQTNAVYGIDARELMSPVVDFAASPDPPHRLTGAAAVSPDGHLAVAASGDGPLQLWKVDGWRPPTLGATLTGPTKTAQQVLFSPDGKLLAAATDESSVWLWDVSDPDAPRVLSTLANLGAPMYSVAFSPTAPLLVAGGLNGHVMVWSLADPTTPAELADIEASDGYILAVAVSPDGRVLTASGANRQVSRWTLDDPAAPTSIGSPLTGPTNDVYWLDYSPDGRLLAAASIDGQVWLWDVSAGASAEPWATLTTHDGALFTAEFSPDGSRLAAGGTGRAVDQWLVDPDAAAAEICATVGARLTEAEWDLYVRDRPYDPPCG